MNFIKEKRYLIILLLIIIIAGFFRLYKLDSIPPGLYPDVAVNGNNALDSLKTGDFKLFYPDNNGREGLIMWLIAFSFWIFGPSVWAIKIVSAVFGTLTVLGVYLLTKELFKKENIALLASFFLAISFWHVNFSRIGFRAILVPFALTFAFYFLFKGFTPSNNKKIYNLIVSGLFFAFGFYTYISYRFVVFILAIALFSWWKIYKKENNQKQFWIFVFWFLVFGFIFSLPIGIYFLGHMQDFFGRAAGVSIFSQQNPLFSFIKSLVVHLGMFNFYGDANWRHNFSGQPELLWPIGIFFIIGFAISIKKAIKAIREKDNLQFAIYNLQLCWFFFMLLPSVLSYEGIPHALRTIGVIPPVMIFSSMGAVFVFEKLSKIYKNKRIFYAIAIIFLLSLPIAEFNKYFITFDGKQEVKDAFSQDLKTAGEYLNSLPDDMEKYVIVNLSGVEVNGIPMPAQTPIFIERAKYGKPRAKYVLSEEEINTDKEAVIIPLAKDLKLLSQIIMKYPKGELEEINNLLIYKINVWEQN